MKMGSGDLSEYSPDHVCENASKVDDCVIFSDDETLMKHITHHEERVLLQEMTNCTRPHSCLLCHKRFASKERLENHLKAHGSEDTKPKQCNICLKRFLNNSALGSHLRTHNGQGFVWKCSICKETHCSRDGLRQHVVSHSSNGLFPCPYCPKVFPGYLPIRKHICKTHKSCGMQCSVCNQYCSNSQVYRKHMLRHSTQKQFSCSHCEKQFKRNDKLKEHVKRMHNCVTLEHNQVCMKQEKKKLVRRRSAEMIIQRKLHEINARYTFKCQPCLLGFKRRGMLVNHIAKYHPNITPEEVPELNLPIVKATRDFFCHLCEKVYKSNAKRKAHIMKFHPGSLKYEHLESKPFDQLVGTITKTPEHCQWCHKQYATNAKLLQHLRSKHSDKSYPELRKKGKRSADEAKFVSTDTSMSKYQNSNENLNQENEPHIETSQNKTINLQELSFTASDVNKSSDETLSVADEKVHHELVLSGDDDDLVLAECLMKLHANLSSFDMSTAEVVRDALIQVEAGGIEMSSVEIACDEACVDVGSIPEEISLTTEDVDLIMAEWLMDLHTEPLNCQTSVPSMNGTAQPLNEVDHVVQESCQLSSVLASCSDVFLIDNPVHHPYEVHTAHNMAQLEPVEHVYSPFPPH